MNIDLDQLLRLTYEDLYTLDRQYMDASGRFHTMTWIYEMIRTDIRSKVNQYLVTINYSPATNSGHLEFHYQTAGNGFMLWHRFRLHDLGFEDPNSPKAEEMRYLADQKILLYTQSRG